MATSTFRYCSDWSPSALISSEKYQTIRKMSVVLTIHIILLSKLRPGGLVAGAGSIGAAAAKSPSSESEPPQRRQRSSAPELTRPQLAHFLRERGPAGS